MSLVNVSLKRNIKRQFMFKLKSYRDMFTTLVVLQVIGILLSMLGSSSEGSGTERLYVQVSVYSADTVISLTYLWAFISAILITTTAYRETDFTFVTNRLSRHLANIGVLITASIISGVTAYLSTFTIKLIAQQITSLMILPSQGSIPVHETLIGLLVVVLYIFLWCSIGYFIGTIAQLHRFMPVLLPVVILGIIITLANTVSSEIIFIIVSFFSGETSIGLFLIKMLMTIFLLLLGTITISSRQEVRRS